MVLALCAFRAYANDDCQFHPLCTRTSCESLGRAEVALAGIGRIYRLKTRVETWMFSRVEYLGLFHSTGFPSIEVESLSRGLKEIGYLHRRRQGHD